MFQGAARVNIERRAQVDQIFQQALERPRKERAAFLNQACANDSSLRNEVASLIEAHELAGRFLNADSPVSGRLAGTKLGSYQIETLIGSGGMGEVYRARDTRLGRTVAIKLVRQDLLGRSDFQRRFRREAQAISALNDPHICGLYDIVIRTESLTWSWNISKVRA
jgi:serine/threonine protein kinase